MGTREGETAPGPSNDDLLRFESHRLTTFSKWPPNSKVGAEKIAKAGFYYTGCYLEVNNGNHTCFIVYHLELRWNVFQLRVADRIFISMI
jgi:hypothetical protein